MSVERPHGMEVLTFSLVMILNLLTKNLVIKNNTMRHILIRLTFYLIRKLRIEINPVVNEPEIKSSYKSGIDRLREIGIKNITDGRKK